MYMEIDQSDRHNLYANEIRDRGSRRGNDGDAVYAISRSRERAHLARTRCLSPANTKPLFDRPSAERYSRRFRKDQGKERKDRVFLDGEAHRNRSNGPVEIVCTVLARLVFARRT